MPEEKLPPPYNVAHDAETTDILDALKYIAATDSRRHIWKDGEYRGCEATYSNMPPDLKTMFHPYIPLIVAGEPWPKLTREYFESHGLPVPPGG